MLSRHYKNHLRSLFISKYIFANGNCIPRVVGLRARLRGPTSGYALMGLFLFLLVGAKSSVRGAQLPAGHSGSATEAMFDVLLNDPAVALSILDKFLLFYLPELEHSANLASIFNSRSFIKGSTTVELRRVFHIFFELDFLTQFAFTFIKVFTARWTLTMRVITNAGSGQVNRTLLRSFSFPA